MFYAIKRRDRSKGSIGAGILFLALAVVTVLIYYHNQRNEYEASKKFWGNYKVEKLDGKNCDSCKIRLYDGYRYDVLVKNKTVGHGKWHIESAIDTPGYFLKVENGPTLVVWERDRLIEYIDRRQSR